MSSQTQVAGDVEILRQPFTLGYTYTRSTGPIVGRFLTELRAGKIVGTRGSDGRVLVPATEYDPVTAEALSEIVEVSDVGTVTNWCWVNEPTEHHPLDKPFAWAMIQLDGADTSMIHAVDTGGDAAAISAGTRVRARWSEQGVGNIKDIACFELGDSSSGKAPSSDADEPLEIMEAPIYLNYNFTAGDATTRFLHQIRRGKIVGQRCPSCSNVYVPPRGSCAACGVATTEEVECKDTGVVESFTIVHIPIPGNPIQPPFVIANIVADGANISFIHLMSECNNDEVEIGMRVKAVWKPESEWGHAMDNIKYFKPLDSAEGGQ